MDYSPFFKHTLERIKSENRYRIFRTLDRDSDFPRVRYDQGEIVSWCGSDYLGMTQHPHMKQKMVELIQSYGIGAGGTRNIGGTHILHVALEKKLAALHQKEAGLLFTSGYVANQAALASLGKAIPDLVFLSDSENHMSMIEGMRQSGAERIVFIHNNMADLEAKLALLPLDRPKMIAFESVYSMSGDFPPLQAIIALAKKYQAMTYLDEVHAIGVYGKRGGGLTEAQNCADEIDIIQGTLGKGLGLIGGYVTARHDVIDVIRSIGNGFIFTTSLPPNVCGTAIEVLNYLQENHTEQNDLADLVTYLKAGLSAANLPLLPSPSQIIPIFIGEAGRCQDLAQRLLDQYHIYIQSVNYPTVKQGAERLRISPTALHTKEQADQLIAALKALI